MTDLPDDPGARGPWCELPDGCRAVGPGLCRRCAGLRSMARTRSDPEADAARLAKIAESARSPEQRAASRASAERNNADPATRRRIAENGRAQAALIAGGRRQATARRLRVLPEEVAEVNRLRDRKGLTEAEAAHVVRQDRRVRERRRQPGGWAFHPLQRGAYGVVMIDPPWHFQTRGAAGDRAVPYDTMGLRAVMDLPVRDLAADDCWLWLWALPEMLPHAMAVLDAWSFNPVTSGTWVKTTASGGLCFGKGYVLRNSEEPYVLARRGRPPVASHSVRNTIMAPRRENSRKPDEAYANAERLFGPARRADVFSRETRPGWESWGREAGKFDPA